MLANPPCLALHLAKGHKVFAMQALLVSKEHDERDILSFVLRHSGLAVAVTTDLNRVTSNWLERPADLIVVAVDDSSGLTPSVQAVRQVTEVPLLLICNPPAEQTLITLLRAGVDLVLPRPVSPRILAQYARTLLRRVGSIPSFMLPELELDVIRLNPASRTVHVTGREPQRLTQLEFRLLYVLMINREQVIPTEMIIERVWGYTGEGNRDLVRGLISRLRRKIEPLPNQPRFIQTIPGTGYRLTLESV